MPAHVPPSARRPRSRDAGFTLLELIVAIGILSVVASIALPFVASVEDRRRAEATDSELELLAGALGSYFDENGNFPADLATLDDQGYLGGRMSDEARDRDAWSRDYAYVVAADTATVTSGGVDRLLATADDRSRRVVATPSRRRATRDEMRTIEVALRNWEALRALGALPDLPAHWDVQFATDGAFRRLADNGFLPNEARFLFDAWGTTYDYAGSPSVGVTTPNLP